MTHHRGEVWLVDFGEPELFVPQKAKALKRFKQLVAVGGIVGMLLAAWVILSLAF